MKYDKIKKNLQANQKVWLVTGCAGFIGSNLTEMLLKLNQKVVGLDNFSTGYQYNLDDIKNCVTESQWENFSFVEGDITDYETCFMVTKGIDIISHQAALGSVPRSIENPIVSNDSNVTGFLNMLTAANRNNVKRFIYASSSAVYGDSVELPKVESVIGNLLSPYAVTKMLNELYAGVFYKLYNIETIGLRYFNVFGKRQDPNGAYAAVIPKWISSLLNGKEVYINGDGETSRDFTYIANAIQANIMAGTTVNDKSYGEVFNAAVGGRNTLNELYNAINEELKINIKDFIKPKPIYRNLRAGDIRHSNANIDKIKKLMQYEPTHDIYIGLKEAILWYIKNLKGKNKC